MIESRKVAVTLTSRVDGDENINLYPGEYAFQDNLYLMKNKAFHPDQHRYIPMPMPAIGRK